MQRADSVEKILMLGKVEDRRRRGQQDEMVGWLYSLHGQEFEQALTNLNSTLKSRDITEKIRIVKTMIFSSSHIWM